MFLQLEQDLHNISSIERISFSEFPDYTGKWRADLYFYGDAEATLTLPHAFASEALARSYAVAAIGYASLVGVCTEEDLASLSAQVEDGSSGPSMSS